MTEWVNIKDNLIKVKDIISIHLKNDGLYIELISPAKSIFIKGYPESLQQDFDKIENVLRCAPARTPGELDSLNSRKSYQNRRFNSNAGAFKKKEDAKKKWEVPLEKALELAKKYPNQYTKLSLAQACKEKYQECKGLSIHSFRVKIANCVKIIPYLYSRTSLNAGKSYLGKAKGKN